MRRVPNWLAKCLGTAFICDFKTIASYFGIASHGQCSSYLLIIQHSAVYIGSITTLPQGL